MCVSNPLSQLGNMEMNQQNLPPYVVVAEECRLCCSKVSHHDLYKVVGLSLQEEIETCSACQGSGIQYRAEKNQEYLVARLSYRFVVVGQGTMFKKIVDQGSILFEPAVRLKEAHAHIRSIELDTSNNNHVGGQYMELQINFEGIDQTLHPYETIQYTPMPEYTGKVLSIVKK